MTTHIFIATTQGLVAIQNITAIDDPDINSVVSVNGTSTTANISSSYHNFVKKGVGIIQQMFGACSYRVDISARIDQGNSWQLAMYLAHLAQAQGMLGNGSVQKGHKVICATGEINTTNQQVLAVGGLATKYKLALPQLKKWTTQGIQVEFLLPTANQDELKNTSFSELGYLKSVRNLQQAATSLPNANSTTKVTNNSAENRQSNATKIKHQLVSVNFRLIAIIFSIIITLLLVWAVSHFAFNGSQPAQLTTTNIELLAKVKGKQQNQDCGQAITQPLVLDQARFADVSLSQLCELNVRAQGSEVQLLLVAQDAYTVLPLLKSPQGWKIPLPKNRSSDRSYFLVSLQQKLTDEKIEQLRLYREQMARPNMLSQKQLSAWLTKQGVNFTIYKHKLLKD